MLTKYIFAASLLGALAEEQTCQNSLEILQLQDTTGSFQGWVSIMRQYTEQLVTRLGEEFGEFHYAVSGFGDKPIPANGWGNYGNLWAEDYCYLRATPFTTDAAEIKAGLDKLVQESTAGGDWPEDVLDAMIYGALDPDLGWSSATHSPSGRPIKKIMMIVTDDLIKEAPAATVSIDNYNAPRVYDESLTTSTGGFGSVGYKDVDTVFLAGGGDTIVETYLELAELYRHVDNNLEMTDAQKERFDALVAELGPESWPAVLPHPGDNSLPCETIDFPTLDQVAKVLKEQNILPILLLAPATYANEAAFEWTQNYYHEKLTALGVEDPLIATLTGTSDGAIADDETVERIINLLKQTQGECYTTALPTEAPTDEPQEPEVVPETPTDEPQEPEVVPETPTDEPQEPEVVPETPTDEPQEPEVVPETPTDEPEEPEVVPETPTDEPEEPEVVPETPTDVPETPETVPETPEVVPETPTDEPEVAPTESEGEETTTQPIVVVPPVVPPAEGGTSVGTIAGASAGAAAGLAAAAAAIWKFGAGFMTPDNSLQVDNLDQVEVPETSVDREALGEITNDMFQ